MQVCAQLWEGQEECGCAVPNSDKSCGQTRLNIGSRHRAAAFFLQIPKACTDLDPTHLYMSILGTYSKFLRENASARLLLAAAMPERWPQICQVKITFESLLNN